MRNLESPSFTNIEKRIKPALLSILLILAIHLIIQYTSAASASQIRNANPLERGINLSHWFFQPIEGYTKKHLDRWITEADFRLLSKTKITHIRLPIDPIFLQQQEPPYSINRQNFIYIDRALKWAENYYFNIIIDLHSDQQLELQAGTSSQAYKNLEKLWIEIAKRYQNQSQHVFFELLNEPEVEKPETWHEIAQKLSQIIREIDQKHTLIVAAPGLSGPSEIANLIPIKDSNVIYTFHFYDPLVFTHQNAFWDPVLSQLQDIPYPYDALRLATSRQKVTNSEALQNLRWYEEDQYNQQKLIESLQAALQFRSRYKVEIYCGEFGVYEAAPIEDKYSWLQDITQLLNQENIGYALWEYNGNFGVINEKTGKPDQEMLRAAGLISS